MRGSPAAVRLDAARSRKPARQHEPDRQSDPSRARTGVCSSATRRISASSIRGSGLDPQPDADAGQDLRERGGRRAHLRRRVGRLVCRQVPYEKRARARGVRRRAAPRTGSDARRVLDGQIKEPAATAQTVRNKLLVPHPKRARADLRRSSNDATASRACASSSGSPSATPATSISSSLPSTCEPQRPERRMTRLPPAQASRRGKANPLSTEANQRHLAVRRANLDALLARGLRKLPAGTGYDSK